MRNTFLSFSPPSIGEEEINEVVDTLRSGWITTGPKVKRFEQEFSSFINAPSALGLNSCTGAVHVALAALDIGSGDSVITTPMTFCSSIHAIEHVGARPILVDVESDTLNLDPNQIREAIRFEKGNRDRRETNGPKDRGRIRAIMPVHLYGHPCEMDEILAIAREEQLAVVEDAAHALPAKYKGRFIGALGHDSNLSVLTCFSFYATKNLTTAEGGMLTGPAALLEEARVWSLHGMSRDAWRRAEDSGDERSWYYEVIRPGFKYNLTDIQAAIGLHQLRKLPGFQARRKEIAQRYNNAFSEYPELQIPTERSEVEHAWHLYVLRLHTDYLTISRDRFINELKARNIGASVHFTPAHLHPYYRDKYGYRPQDFPRAFAEYNRIVSLPLHPMLSDEDVEDVITAVVEIAKKHGRRRVSAVTK